MHAQTIQIIATSSCSNIICTIRKFSHMSIVHASRRFHSGAAVSFLVRCHGDNKILVIAVRRLTNINNMAEMRTSEVHQPASTS